MSRTRKVFLVIMACVTLLFATACGKKDSSTGGGNGAGGANYVGGGNTSSTFKHGTWSGNTYTSEFLGIKIQVDSSWNIFSDADLAQSAGIPDMSDSSIKSVLDRQGMYITDMYALDNKGASINITVQDNSSSLQLDLDAFLDAGVAALENEYSLMGYNMKANKSEVAFLGQTAKCIRLEATIQDQTLYGIQIPIINKPYYSAVTLGSFDKSELDKFLSWITAA